MTEITDYIKNFSKTDCPIHKVKKLDHICAKVDCADKNVLFCSKCLVQDEKHTTAHKISLQPLESYLNSRLQVLSGEELQAKLDQMNEDLATEREKFEAKIGKLEKDIHTDFNEIQQNVTVLCTTIKNDLLSQLKHFRKTNLNLLEEIQINIQYNLHHLQSEKDVILNEFADSLKNNFEFDNINHLNSFIKKLKTKTTNFSVELPTNQIREQLNAIMHDYNNNPYYNSEIVSQIKNNVDRLLSQPYQLKEFINLEPIPIQRTYFDQLSEELKQQDDKRTILAHHASDAVASIQKICTFTTANKLSVNNIVVLDESSFATSSNDQKIKVWGFTPNYVIYEKAAINLNALCVHLKYWRQKKHLFLALSDHNIVCYNLDSEVQFVRSYVGHDRSLKAISLSPSLNIIYSVNLEGVLKVFDVDYENEIGSTETGAHPRVIDSNSDKCAIGYKSGLVKVFDQELNTLTEFYASKEKITAVVLSELHRDLGLVGSENGTVCYANLATGEVLHKFVALHSARLHAISLIEGVDAILYFVSAGWDNVVKLVNLQTKQIVSNVKTKLLFDEKKHHNTDGARLIYRADGEYLLLVSGNNDKNLDVLKVAIE